MTLIRTRALVLFVSAAVVTVLWLSCPWSARVAIDETLTVLTLPGRAMTDWILLGAMGQPMPLHQSAPAVAVRDLERRYRTELRTLLYGQPHEGVAEEHRRLYRAAADLAMRDRYVPLNHFVSAPLLGRSDSPFSSHLRVGCGRDASIREHAPVFAAGGHLVGVTTAVSVLTSTMLPLDAPTLRIMCDVPGPVPMQGMLAGPWQPRTVQEMREQGRYASLQLTSAGCRPPLGVQVFTSTSAQIGEVVELPSALSLGRIVALESTAEGSVRAKVRLWGDSLPDAVFVMTSRGNHAEQKPEAELFAARCRYRAESMRLHLFSRLHIPEAMRECQQIDETSAASCDLTAFPFAVQHRSLAMVYSSAVPLAADGLGLPPGIPFLQGGSRAGILTEGDRDALECRFLTGGSITLVPSAAMSTRHASVYSANSL